MKITKEMIQNAECTLENLICPVCEKTENTLYNQYSDICTCEDCGHEW